MSFANGYTYRRPITVDHTKVPNSNQADFPVVVAGTYTYLKHTTHSGLVTDLNGYDIAFYSDAAGTTPLSWEIESYNHETGAVVFWVKVPSVSYATDTVIYMFYGKSSVSTFQSTATAVWDSNFKGVYHLKGATLSAADSTGVNNGTISGASATTGKIDGGASFTGSSSNRITVANNTSLNPSNELTVSFWIKTANTGAMLVSKTEIDQYYTYIGGGDNISLKVFTSSGGLEQYSASHFADGTWHHFTATWNNSDGRIRIYRDGVLDVTSSGTLAGTLNSTTSPMYFGFGYAGNYLTGSLDEVRISSSRRSGDWIAAEYANQSSPSTFYTVGSETTSLTGTAAVTGAKATVALTGVFIAPVTGTAAVTTAKPAVAISGAYTAPLKTGTAEVAAGQPTVEVAGTYTTPLKTGTVAVEAAKPTIDASGTFEQPVGGAVIAAKPTIAISGAYAPPLKTGEAAVTTGQPTVGATAAYTPPHKTGTADVAAARPAVAVTSTYTPPLKAGTGEVAARAATVALAGITAGPMISGTVAVVAPGAAVAIYGDMIVLPPPSLSGFRVGAWFRPA